MMAHPSGVLVRGTLLIASVSLLLSLWLTRSTAVGDDAASQARELHRPVHTGLVFPLPPATAYEVDRIGGYRESLAPYPFRRQLHAEARREALAALLSNLSLHAVGSQLYTAWNAPATLKALNWYGFEYAPF